MLNILILLLTMGLPAFAAEAPVTGSALMDLLREYRIVRGDEQGNLNLDKAITRAEMFTIMVRALGKDDMAAGYHGLGLFHDSKGHWADGYLSYAKVAGLAKGDGNNYVEPNRPVTNAEALTMILRVIGKEPTTGDWPYNVIIEALDLKIVPEGISAANLSEPAVRGIAFTALGRALVLPVGETGLNYFQQLVDSVPPSLTVNNITDSTTAAKVTVSGKADGATRVTVNGAAVVLQAGTFSAEVALKYGPNDIRVEAQDNLGNKSAWTAKVSRIQPIARIEVSGPSKVPMGGSAMYTVTAFDSSNNPVSTEGIVASVTGDIGLFNLATGELKSVSRPALGSIVLKAGDVTKTVDVQVLGQSASAVSLQVFPATDVAPINRDMTVQVRVVDGNGEIVTNDYGRSVNLTATGLSGLVVTPAAALTDAGVAEFKVRGAQAGLFTLTATSANLAGGSAVGEIGTSTRVVLTTDPGTITLGGAVTMTRIRATLVDENNTPVVNNSGFDIAVSLSASNTDGTLFDDLLIINRGESSSQASGNDGMFSVGVLPGTVKISGRISSGHTFSVAPTSLTMIQPSIGSASKLRILGLQASGNSADYLLMVTDQNDNQITTGSVAFQVKVTTSNNDPENVSVDFGGYNVVSDGYAENHASDGNDRIGRTIAGAAVLRVTYNKPGIVTLTPVGASSTSEAIDANGNLASASSSSGMQLIGGNVVFRSDLGDVKLTVDSDLGNDQIAGALPAGSRQFTLRAWLTDLAGNWVPGTTARVTLVRETETPAAYTTTLPTNMSVNANDGKAEFKVTATSTGGEDRFYVQAVINQGQVNEQTFTSDLVTLQVQKAAPATPVIAAVRGVKDGVPGTLNRVGTNDTGLEMDLYSVAGEHYGIVKVYNGNTLIYTSDALDLGASIPRVTIPKAKLPNGVFSLTVTARNGYGESSPKSAPSAAITHAQEVTNVYVNYGRYDAASDQFLVYGNGFSSADTINAGLFEVRDGSNIYSLSGATQVSVTSSTITYSLAGLPVATTLKDTALVNGKDVRLDALAGWYSRSNGQTAKEDLDNAVTPMGHIEYAIYDRTNKRLTLKGSGFDTGALDFRNIKLHIPGMDDPSAPGYVADITLYGMSQTKYGDTEWFVTLSDAAATALNNNATYVVTALRGWQTDGGKVREAITAIPIQAAAAVTEATYNANNDQLILKGIGFLNGDVTVGSIRLRDTDKAKSVSLAGGTFAPIVSDTEIVITLEAADATFFENTDNFAVNIYLEADSGWFTNSFGRDSAAITIPSIRLPSRVSP